jgi:aconitase A
VRLRERLVQVEVDDVEPHVAGPRDPHHRVEVRAVVVERRAGVVHDPRDLLDVAVEQPERVRVREHQAGHVLAGLLPQVV